MSDTLLVVGLALGAGYLAGGGLYRLVARGCCRFGLHAWGPLLRIAAEDSHHVVPPSGVMVAMRYRQYCRRPACWAQHTVSHFAVVRALSAEERAALERRYGGEDPPALPPSPFG